MERRYYIAPLVGTGAPDDAHRPRLPGASVVGNAQVIASGADGRPRLDWALVLVAAENFAAFDTDVELDELAREADLTRPLGPVRRQRAQAAAARRGAAAADIRTGADAVLAVGRLLTPDFAVEDLRVP